MNEEDKNPETGKPTIFWIMQYNDEFMSVYRSFKRKLEGKYQFIDPLENKNQTSILEKIIPNIIAADYVIADVSTVGYDSKDNAKPLHNGNVMFELGIAMSYRKKIIMISASELKELPFDFMAYQANRYVNKHEPMEKFITEIQGILDNSATVYKNPVLDWDRIYEIVPKNRERKAETGINEETEVSSSSAVDYYLYFKEEEDYYGEYDTYFGFRKCVWPQPKLPLAQMREFLRFKEFEHTFGLPEWGELETLTLRVGVMEVEEFRSKFSKEMRQKNYRQGRHIFERAHNMLKSEFIDNINGNDNYDCPF